MKKIKKLILLGLFCTVSLGASAYSFITENEDGVTIFYNVCPSFCDIIYGAKGYPLDGNVYVRIGNWILWCILLGLSKRI